MSFLKICWRIADYLKTLSDPLSYSLAPSPTPSPTPGVLLDSKRNSTAFCSEVMSELSRVADIVRHAWSRRRELRPT